MRSAAMKALVLNRYSQLDFQDFPTPAPAAEEVLVHGPRGIG